MNHKERLKGPCDRSIIPSECGGELVETHRFVDRTYKSGGFEEVPVVIELCRGCGARLAVEVYEPGIPYVRNVWYGKLPADVVLDTATARVEA